MSLPAAPLLAEFGGNACATARAVGVTVRAVERWKSGGLSALQADRAAIAIGIHPANLWPDWLTIEWRPKCSDAA